MSSLEIAELTGKPHNDVLKDIRRILTEVEIDLGRFSQVYKAGNGQMQPCFHLPRRECDLIVAGYSAKYRLAIIDRWQELETKNTLVLRDIRSVFDEVVIRTADISAVYKNSQNKDMPCFPLPRRECGLVESRHDKVKQSIERLAARGAIELTPVGKLKITKDRPGFRLLNFQQSIKITVPSLPMLF